MARSSQSSTPYTLSVGDLTVEVRPKRMKHMYLRIDNATGDPIITCPLRTSSADIHAFVKEKYHWIKEKQRQILDSPTALANRATKEEQAEWRKVVAAATPGLIAKWEPIMGVKAKKIVYRNMKSRWGTCQPSTGRICINTRLALFPPDCLEYVVVHELCHLLVSGHGPQFKKLMDQYLPGWRKIRASLK